MLHLDDLQLLQEMLRKAIVREIKRPMIDFDSMREMASTMERVDTLRRMQWHKDKFGAYEEMAEEALHTLAPDDIPF